uniref:NADH-ubiquinone oxidoreductase chain 2 n=3 Tax=Amblyopinae TaxID=497680 RepID=H7CD60_9GOBI|nr:NADH dehydrogenase subunit 2 [Odontamblyopus rubicundus]YP_009233362.1 NADH dehydrogenase subunit 2 [Taenioides anguillaris]UNH92416.1 NADH dehydrogenase subunit 2 [Taenioides sp. Ruosonghe]WCK11723.1 NADH dehydrogenase subunit 2 [Taenioides cirratus]BAL68105.1 NADH dehydrogenase subunit 2 [Taenioides sp. Snyderi TK-2011]AFV61898.1 NADH dehydrogenase subunit 2 [Odontamblyopus rubicundus]AMB27242.1 NADH dehydrogenase subunit 2 [Taenioides anguillaris]
MSPYITALLFFGLFLGTTITASSSHWLLAWMGLEINTLAIIPLMAQSHHPRAIEATTKYFLTQATAAATLLFASITNAWLTGQWDITLMTHPVPTAMITLALALKLGLAPLHTWLPEVLQGLTLTTGLILSTWQKLAPFILLLQIPCPSQDLLIILGLSSTLVGGWGGLNQTQLRKILAYSSIAHLGWMLLIIQFAPSLTLLALTMYLVMTTATFLTLQNNKATNINALSTSWAKAPLLTATTPLLLLSLGGLPPMTGFLPKWLILQELTKQQLPMTAVLAALTALLSLYFYLRLCYAMTLTMPPNNLAGSSLWRLPTLNPSLLLATSALTAILLLPLAPAITALLHL